MKDLHLITVGKLGDKNIEELERDYLKRLTTPRLIIHEVRAHSENVLLESKEVITKIDEITKSENAYIVLLAENGKQFTSVDFSQWLNQKQENSAVILIIGGASGHGQAVIDRCDFKLSLSELTYPHKLARLILVEQIYRAQTIKNRHPYHK